MPVVAHLVGWAPRLSPLLATCSMAYGKDEVAVKLNHPRALYEQGGGAKLLGLIKARSDWKVRFGWCRD